MQERTGKRVAKVKVTLSKRSLEALEPADKPWIAWDDKLTGFGVRVQPSGTKTFVVNYRVGEGGRRAPNRRVSIGKYPRISPEKARHRARQIFGRVALGEDPAKERVQTRSMPTLEEAFEDYMAANPNRKAITVQRYRQSIRVNLPDWRARPLDAISRRDVERKFDLITEQHGWAAANQTISLLRSIFRRSCVDHEGLRNPVELWLAGGGRYHPKRRRRISAPSELLPRWRAAIDEVGLSPAQRDIFLVGAYTGMRVGEIVSLRWSRVDLERRTLRVEQTKTGEPLELPVTRQLAGIFERRQEEDGGAEGWVFPSSTSAAGHLGGIQQYYADIGRAAGTRFWFHGLRNVFITIAERELMLSRSLTKRLVNHAPGDDLTEGYAADWTAEQLREPAQRVADRIDELMKC